MNNTRLIESLDSSLKTLDARVTQAYEAISYKVDMPLFKEQENRINSIYTMMGNKADKGVVENVDERINDALGLLKNKADKTSIEEHSAVIHELRSTMSSKVDEDSITRAYSRIDALQSDINFISRSATASPMKMRAIVSDDDEETDVKILTVDQFSKLDQLEERVKELEATRLSELREEIDEISRSCNLKADREDLMKVKIDVKELKRNMPVEIQSRADAAVATSDTLDENIEQLREMKELTKEEERVEQKPPFNKLSVMVSQVWPSVFLVIMMIMYAYRNE